MAVICPYCDRPAKLVGGNSLYPHRPDLYAKRFYRCQPCDAWVGCHGNTVIPLGRLANPELRREKQAAHAAFDPLWKSKEMKRSDAYKWLSEAIGISRKNCHIGMFDVDACRATVAAAKARNESTAKLSIGSVQHPASEVTTASARSHAASPEPAHRRSKALASNRFTT